MFEVQLLIPNYHNNGKKFTVAHHTAFEVAVAKLVGGLTRLPNVATGHWVNQAGTHFADETRVYLLALSSITEGAKIGEVAALAKRHYEQEAIYLRYLGVAEIL